MPSCATWADAAAETESESIDEDALSVAGAVVALDDGIAATASGLARADAGGAAASDWMPRATSGRRASAATGFGDGTADAFFAGAGRLKNEYSEPCFIDGPRGSAVVRLV